MMVTIPTYSSFKCDQCGSLVRNAKRVHKCSVCSINLCDVCYRERSLRICNWCEQEIPARHLRRRGVTVLFLIITPLLLLFLPIPRTPITIFFEKDPSYLLEKILLISGIAVSIILYSIILIVNRVQMMKIVTLKSKE